MSDPQEIMQRLHIAEATVKTHVRHILSKLDAQSRTQAILVAMHLGLVAAPS
jgi:DNA-binding NarL/FixJ family response regulator